MTRRFDDLIRRMKAEHREARMWLAMTGGLYLYSARLSEYEDEMHSSYTAARNLLRKARAVRDHNRSDQ